MNCQKLIVVGNATNSPLRLTSRQSCDLPYSVIPQHHAAELRWAPGQTEVHPGAGFGINSSATPKEDRCCKGEMPGLQLRLTRCSLQVFRRMEGRRRG